MRIRLRTAVCLSALVVTCGGLAQTVALTPVRLTPDDLVWVERASGVQRAAVVDDETKPGMYATRWRFPSGFRVQPHFHPDERTVVVL